MREHYFLIKWTPEDGFVFDGEVESELFPNGTLWNTETKDWEQVPSAKDNKTLREHDQKLVDKIHNTLMRTGE